MFTGAISENKYKKQIVENLDYSKFDGFKGKYNIKVGFNVKSDGSFGEFSFEDSPDQVFNNEIIRVMKESGNWIPATLSGQNVNTQLNLTLRIEIP